MDAQPRTVDFDAVDAGELSVISKCGERKLRFVSKRGLLFPRMARKNTMF